MESKNYFDVAIIDYTLGNLFSVKKACEFVRLKVVITSNPKQILSSKMVVLPGVGAFGSAMKILRKLELDKVLKEVVFSDKVLFCICLGMQLLMTESYEFGKHKGLNIIKGKVIKLKEKNRLDNVVKVPHVGWNEIYYNQLKSANRVIKDWINTPLDGVKNYESLYFVHSYHVVPDDQSLILSKTVYGDQEFCSSLHFNNIFACQFHPERSAKAGLKIYANLAKKIQQMK